VVDENEWNDKTSLQLNLKGIKWFLMGLWKHMHKKNPPQGEGSYY